MLVVERDANSYKGVAILRGKIKADCVRVRDANRVRGFFCAAPQCRETLFVAAIFFVHFTITSYVLAHTHCLRKETTPDD